MTYEDLAAAAGYTGDDATRFAAWLAAGEDRWIEELAGRHRRTDAVESDLANPTEITLLAVAERLLHNAFSALDIRAPSTMAIRPGDNYQIQILLDRTAALRTAYILDAHIEDPEP